MARSAAARGITRRLARRKWKRRAAELLVWSDGVCALSPRMSGLSDSDLKDFAGQRLAALEDGSGIADLTNEEELFAALRETARRNLGLHPYPVQIAAARALCEGFVAELATGEGKTLSAALAAAIQAHRYGRCHVLTFNDYLAGRDADWMAPFFGALGISVAAVQSSDKRSVRRKAFEADVTYATAKQAGFDLLADGLVYRIEDAILPPLEAVIVDEADSILIDEARIPLVIAGAREDPPADLDRIAELVRDLAPERHYQVDREDRNVNLTESGLRCLENELQVDLHEDASFRLLTAVNQALFARVLLQKDIDYLIRNGRLELIDELTGRVVPDRRWPDGIQSAVEAKEGLTQLPGGHVLASITLPHLLQRYSVRSGMTATAMAAAHEFEFGYGMPVLSLPPNVPSVRKDWGDVILATKAQKERYLVRRVEQLHRRGRPVLIGTGSVKESERIGSLLADRDIPSQILNARNDAEEAAVIADAGAPGAVTVSTNMAGRGTDIRLGGKDGAARDEVVKAGGLFVIGTNRHESSRTDAQLRGRAARQGDPGETQFVVSLEDPLMLRNDIASLLPKRRTAQLGDGQGRIEDIRVWREVERVQRMSESRDGELRATTSRYSEVLDRQRAPVLDWR
ncbi:MAG: accessory Sec system translocase SecA2, partial [Rhodothermales bacterium]|nr:accessory Sec system translocase SecA2 [Rhodothermales bacterium]